jgi:hypothetical protein
MASEEGLKILLKGEVQDFLKDMKSAKDAIFGTASAAADAVKSFLGLSSAADDASKSLNEEAAAANKSGQANASVGKFIRQMTYERKAALIEMRNGTNGWKLEKKAIEDAVQPLQKVQKQSGNTRAAMAGLNNIVRDAPYGFGAVANNITQLTDALFGASLAANVATFGISLLVTAGVSLVQKYGSLSNAIDALTGRIDYQKKLQKELNEELLKGRQEAQAEIINAQRLFDVAKNTNLSLEDRKRAIRELRSEYPIYLKNISDEELLAGRASAAYDKLKNALLESARARAIANKAAENAAKDLELEAKGLEVADQLAKINEELAQRQKIQAQLAGTPGSQGTGRDAILALQQAQLEKDINQIYKERAAIIAQNEDLQKKLGNTAAGIGGINGPKIKEDAKLAYKGLSDLNSVANQVLLTFSRFSHLKGFGVDGLTSMTDGVVTQTKAIDAALTGFQFTAQKKLQEMIKPLQDKAKEIKIELDSALSTAFSGLGQTIGQAIGGGGLQAAFNGVISIFSNFIKQIGEALIASGVAMLAAKALIKNPTTAIAAGVAAVAISSALQATIKNNVPAFATGGKVTGPTLAMVGDNPSGIEYMIPKEVLDKVSGGNNGFVAETRLSGSDILVVVKRAGLNQNRING